MAVAHSQLLLWMLRAIMFIVSAAYTMMDTIVAFVVNGYGSEGWKTSEDV